MKQSLIIRTGAATIVATALSLSALPAAAQGADAYRQYCQQINGHLVCKRLTGSAGAAGTRPYERWENGSPAQASGSSGEYRYPAHDPYAFPQSFGAYSNLNGLGR